MTNEEKIQVLEKIAFDYLDELRHQLLTLQRKTTNIKGNVFITMQNYLHKRIDRITFQLKDIGVNYE